MNLDDMAREAMSRVSYATAANAEWQKKKVAEKFAELRKSSEPAPTLDQVRAKEMARLMQNAHPNFSIQMYAGQAAYWNASLLNSMIGGAGAGGMWWTR